jgi:hypothetical protein
MPIPGFDSNGVIPPFLGGDPGAAAGRRAPYATTALEVVQSLATSKRRCEILDGWLLYRDELRAVGMGGFQWIDGSFCEQLKGREPNDVDMVTFYSSVSPTATIDRPDLFMRAAVKARYHCDAFFFAQSLPAPTLIQVVHYWYGLFSHRRGDLAWKGMLQVDLTQPEDPAVRAALQTASAGFP